MTTGDFLCAACARPGETTAPVAGIGRCTRCPRRTGRQLVGAASDRDDFSARAPAAPPAPPAAPPSRSAALVERRPPPADDLAARREAAPAPATAPPERGPVRFGPPLRVPYARG